MTRVGPAWLTLVAGACLGLCSSLGCSGSTPRDMYFGTDAGANFDVPPAAVDTSGAAGQAGATAGAAGSTAGSAGATAGATGAAGSTGGAGGDATDASPDAVSDGGPG